MPLVNLQFNLPEEQESYAWAVKANDMYGALADIKQMFRNSRKFDSPDITEKDFFNILKDYGLEEMF